METEPQTQTESLAHLPNALGPLRTVLVALSLLGVLGAAFAGGEVTLTFPEVISTLIAPPFAVMMAFVLALDMLMTRLFMSDRTGLARQRLRWVLGIEGAVFVLLIVAWAPFFSQFASR